MLNVADKGKKAKLVLDISSSDSSSEGEEESNPIQQTRVITPKAKQKGKAKSSELQINKKYAERYDNWRNLEEMQKLKDRLGVNDISELKDEKSSSESFSEEEEDWSEVKEKAFLKTLACLKTKDPKIYTGKFGFFNVENDEPSSVSAQDSSKKKKEVNKRYTVRDHERTMVLEKASRFSDDEDGLEESTSEKSKVAKSYPEELASIKTEFSKALNDIDSSDEDDEDNLLGSKLLKRRTNKSSEENEREGKEYTLWLKGELGKVENGKLSKQDAEELKSLREYWNDDKLDEGEKFLRDYILNQKYIDPLRKDGDYIPSYNEVVHDDDNLSDDEKFEADREEFEHKYNFRFEEPDQDFIKRYPRTIQDSMRRDDTTRKEQREKAKERKEETKARHKEEVQRLKALKRIEIMDKIKKLHEITGDPDLNLSEMDIDGDFNPEEYDRRMQQIFDDKYYKEAADDEKPVFEYDAEIDDDEKWDRWIPAREKASDAVEDESADSAENDEDGASEDREDSEFFGRDAKKAATQKELIEASTGKRNRRKRSAFLEALEREKPKFDPKIHKSFNEYFEEYYNLDFEDVVGNLKCRFKYHKTTPNDFGLTTDEILKADDKELNQWASLKKTFQYRPEDEEQYEVQAYKKKASKEELKKRMLLSLYQPLLENDANEDDEEGNEDTQKKKRKKKNKKKNKRVAEASIVADNHDDISEPVDNKRSTKKPRSGATISVPVTNAKIEETPLHVISSAKGKQSPKQTASSADTPKLSKRQRKNKKKQSRPENGETLTTTSPTKPQNQHSAAMKANSGTGGKNKGKKHFDNEKRGIKRKATNNATNEVQVDEERLRAYGLNPKKFKKQMKYGNSASKT